MFESENGGSDEVKDDRPGPTFITYNILFVCFLVLFIFGMVNLCLARQIRKRRSKPIITFYFASQVVVFLRVLLFADTFIDWGWQSYVIIFVSFPSYLYLIVGLSQVMLTLESIVKYKNFKILETRAITKC